MNAPILAAVVRGQPDVVAARQRARQIAELLGFDPIEQTRIATAVSEVARNSFEYAKGGTVEFALLGSGRPQYLTVRVADKGPGIAQLQAVLDGRYQSPTGLGVGLAGSRRLMDTFAVDSTAGGTTVTMGKALPAKTAVLAFADVGRLGAELAKRQPKNPAEEVEQQNRELLRTLDELRARQEELLRLNEELAETNRGVVALYAELDDKADRLAQADAVKTRFLSYLSHEFRTPVLSALGLAKLLLAKTDGELTAEQEHQVSLIKKSMEGLSELSNDLLDLAKVQAGKVDVRVSAFDAGALLGALRGMFRPLQPNPAVALVIEEPPAPVMLHTDEAKVAQILRNFVSNALKFTERGEVRVTAAAAGGAVTFTVADTGIGIAPADVERVFQEFSQIDSKLQRKHKGTGLGLPLSKKLAELLGGSVRVTSEVGRGSAFAVTVPARYAAGGPAEELLTVAAGAAPPVVLIVDDDAGTRYLIRAALGDAAAVAEAGTAAEGRRLAAERRPGLIFLDLSLPDGAGLLMMEQWRADAALAAVPIIIHSSQTLSPADTRRVAAGNAGWLPKGAAPADIRRHARAALPAAFEPRTPR